MALGFPRCGVVTASKQALLSPSPILVSFSCRSAFEYQLLFLVAGTTT